MIQIHAASVNLLDSKLRDGEFKLFLPYRPPFVLGHDSPEQSSRSGPRSRNSSSATKSFPGRAIIASALSPNSSPSTNPTSR